MHRNLILQKHYLFSLIISYNANLTNTILSQVYQQLSSAQHFIFFHIASNRFQFEAFYQVNFSILEINNICGPVCQLRTKKISILLHGRTLRFFIGLHDYYNTMMYISVYYTRIMCKLECGECNKQFLMRLSYVICTQIHGIYYQ